MCGREEVVLGSEPNDVFSICLQPFRIDSGVDQGCLLSVVGFLYYNADILDIPDKKNVSRLVLH